MSRRREEEKFRIVYQKALQKAGAMVTYMTMRDLKGVPDLFVLDDGVSIWQELKFVSDLPAETETGLLGHCVTGPQQEFLSEINQHDGLGVVAIGQATGINRSRRLSVAFFLPEDFSRHGQITRAAYEAGAHRAWADDGQGCLAVIKSMMTQRRRAPTSTRQQELWHDNQDIQHPPGLPGGHPRRPRPRAGPARDRQP